MVASTSVSRRKPRYPGDIRIQDIRTSNLVRTSIEFLKKWITVQNKTIHKLMRQVGAKNKRINKLRDALNYMKRKFCNNSDAAQLVTNCR